METRVAVIGIIVEDTASVDALNGILHEYARHIVGRMGVPYRARGVSIISIAVDAPHETIAALAGRVGALPGVNARAAYSNVTFSD